MKSKTCSCGQVVFEGDRYCIGCNRPISWKPPVPTKEANKILESLSKKKTHKYK